MMKNAITLLTLLGPAAAQVQTSSAQSSPVNFGPISVPATSVIFDPDDVLTATATGTVPVVVTTPAGSSSSTVNLGPYGPSFLLLDSKYATATVPTTGPGNSGAGYDIIGPAGRISLSDSPR